MWQICLLLRPCTSPWATCDRAKLQLITGLGVSHGDLEMEGVIICVHWPTFMSLVNVTLDWTPDWQDAAKKNDMQPSGNSRHGSLCRTLKTGNQSDDSDDSQSEAPQVDPHILAAIKQAVREVINTTLSKIDEALQQLVQLSEHMVDVERSMQFTSDRLETAVTTLLPAMTAHMSQLAEGLSWRQLELEVHRRQWNLVIHGIEGTKKEDEAVTRQVCRGFAKEVLRVEDADATVFAACHRLSTKRNAGIIIRFMDLVQRDQWLSGTKNLKNSNKKISISPDLPPVLRPAKDELLQECSKLPLQIKQNSRIKFLPQWSFVQLKVEGQAPKSSSLTLRAVTTSMAGVDPLLQLNESKTVELLLINVY